MHFDKVHPPTKLERFNSMYFEMWLEYAREEQRRQQSSNNEESITTFEGFGKVAEGAWQQWMDYLEDQILPEVRRTPADEEE